MKRYGALTVITLAALGMGLSRVVARNSARPQFPSRSASQVALVSQQLQQAQAVDSQAQATAPVDLASAPYLRNLSAAARGNLSRDGFVVASESSWSDVSGFYRGLKQDNIPIFVSSDAMLHTSHRLFDWSLRFLEAGYLRDDMLGLTDALLREMMAYHDQTHTPLAREAALLTAAYFSVGKRLVAGGGVSDVPQPYRARIEKEISLVRNAQGLSTSPLMGYREDYTQYKPRGHYSRSEGFERYFRGLMWYGRMTFRVSPAAAHQPGVNLDERAVQRQALAAAMIATALRTTRVKGERAMDVWRRIYDTTAYFAGPSDDLTFTDCARARASAFGPGGAGAFDDARRLRQFMTLVQALPRPRILSGFSVWRQEPGWQQQAHAISFMGQRYSPDALILNQLVFDRVGEWQGRGQAPFTLVNARGLKVRGLPRGLDAMAGLGSDVALQILKQEGDTAYRGYDSQLAAVRRAVAAIADPEWSRNLYMLRLVAAKDLLTNPPGAAGFMRSPAWSLKQLQTALGAWTELKHDTILYTKQSYAMAQSAMAGMGKAGAPPPRPRFTRGYVEPVPAVYGRLAAGVEQLRDQLNNLGYPRDRALEENLANFAGLLRSLEIISNKELGGHPLSDQEYNLIWNIGERLSLYLGFPHHTDITMAFMDPYDRGMPIVADVATDVNSGQVLEEALGRPRTIYVVAPVTGKPTACKGVTYSYYEFKQPMSKRLTVEKWRGLLYSRYAPTRPRWTDPFIGTEGIR